VIRSSPTSRLRREDFPTLGRPTIAILIGSSPSAESAGSAAPSSDSISESSSSIPIRCSAPIGRGSPSPSSQSSSTSAALPEPELRKLVDVGRLRGPVDLVGDQEHAGPAAPEVGGDVAVERRHPCAGVDHEEDQLRLGEGRLRLEEDLAPEGDLVESNPPGV